MEAVISFLGRFFILITLMWFYIFDNMMLSALTNPLSRSVSVLSLLPQIIVSEGKCFIQLDRWGKNIAVFQMIVYEFMVSNSSCIFFLPWHMFFSLYSSHYNQVQGHRGDHFGRFPDLQRGKSEPEMHHPRQVQGLLGLPVVQGICAASAVWRDVSAVECQR